jgi:hypothetical protein
MIPKSGYRFSEKIMLKHHTRAYVIGLALSPATSGRQT